MPVSASASSRTSRYLPHGPFHAELKRRVDAYFTSRNIEPTRAPGMRLKTAIILGWFVGSYLLLAYWAASPWTAIPLAISLGLAVAGIGFNIQHDGNHGGYSRNRRLNAAMAFTLDVVGGSSYVWSWKHNVFHHSNPNLVGLDVDIDIQPFCRLAPTQKRRPWHRFQHLYIWPLYAFLAVKWHFIDDFKDVAQGTVGGQGFPRPKGWKLFSFLAGKLLFVGWAFVLPALFHPVWKVILFYALASAVVSLTLAIVFQLAHAVDGADFPRLDSEGRAATEWAAHQVRTSMDFAPGNRLLSWYIGGLNFQIEHHLFPRVCHVHLKDLAPIVQQTCREFDVPYNVEPTALGALAAHGRWLYRLGRPEAETLAAPTPALG
jgi:linoleoyl-CoA desaturase